MDAELEALAREWAPSARVGLIDLLSAEPPDYEARERQQWLRLVIAALGIEHAKKPARFAQLNVPARFVSSIAEALHGKGYVVRKSASYTEEYRSLTIWQEAALRDEMLAEDLAGAEAEQEALGVESLHTDDARWR